MMGSSALLNALLLLLLSAIFCITAQECSSDKVDSCRTTSAHAGCMNPSEFNELVASFYQDESVISLLRGTVDNVISEAEAKSFVHSLPDFRESFGYDENSNGRAYAAPEGYSALGLKELKSFPEVYNKLIEIREQVRSMTEKSLNICPGSLYIDFTTISRKVEGGAHRPHADNCIHSFHDKVATCDTSQYHPYPKRVAASILYLNDPDTGNFEDGQFYFANRTNNGEVEEGGAVDISMGRLVYFTSGVENFHGALPVREKKGNDNDSASRLALAMWYVFDKNLKESLAISDPNDPAEIFTLQLPIDVDLDALLLSMGAHLVSRQDKPMTGAWKVSKYGHSALHVLFKDHSAMFSITFMKSGSRIVVERHTDTNKRASLQYMLQESVILHSVLDEFSKRIISQGALDEIQRARFNKGVDDARSRLPTKQAS